MKEVKNTLVYNIKIIPMKGLIQKITKNSRTMVRRETIMILIKFIRTKEKRELLMNIILAMVAVTQMKQRHTISTIKLLELLLGHNA